MGVPVGGASAMITGAVMALIPALLLMRALTPRAGRVSGIALPLLLWTLVVIGLVTLLPARHAMGVVPASEHPTTCSTDIGGPAPTGFWIFGGGQRLLNMAIFVPSGFLLPFAFGRWRSLWALVPVGLLGLLAYSVGIEFTQLYVARIGRSCDVTDMIDNGTGALLGFTAGLVIAVLWRPWRRLRHPASLRRRSADRLRLR